MKISRKVKLVALSLAAVVLTACSGKSAQAAPQEQTIPSVSPGDTTPITHIAYLDLGVEFATSPNGLYTIAQLRPGARNLFYVDMETQQETYLCSVPGCTHDNESCTSYLYMGEQSIGFSLFYFQDHLYAVQNVPANGKNANIIRMDPDGSNRETVVTLNDDETFAGHIFGYGDSILCEIGVSDPEIESWTQLLERIDLETGTREVILQYPGENRQTAISLMGAAGTNFYYLDQGDQAEAFQYYKVDLSLGSAAFDTLKENPVGPEFDNIETFCTIQNDYFCTYDSKSNLLSYENLLTGEKKEFPAPELEEGEKLYGLVHLYDDRFALSIDDAEKNIVMVLLDPETNQPTGVRHTVSEENSQTILGTFGDSLLYLARYEEMPLKDQDKLGLEGELAYYSVFGTVSKEDYWNGNTGTEIAFPSE